MPGVSAAAVASRERLIILAAAASVMVLAWVALARIGPVHALTLLEPHRQPADAGSLAVRVLMWQLMMVAMMVPAVLPWIVSFAAIAPRRGNAAASFGSALRFVSGYFTVWLAYSVAAGALQALLQRHAAVAAEPRVGAWFGGAALIIAGAFQLTSLKRACLIHCRSPLSYFLARWRNGPIGEFRMGVGHGLYCVGCCWALMALSLALGIMNVAWMAVLTVIVCAEQLAPRGDRLARLAGLGLGLWGLCLWLLVP